MARAKNKTKPKPHQAPKMNVRRKKPAKLPERKPFSIGKIMEIEESVQRRIRRKK